MYDGRSTRVLRPSNTLYHDRHTGRTAAVEQAHNNVNKVAKRKKVTIVWS